MENTNWLRVVDSYLKRRPQLPIPGDKYYYYYNDGWYWGDKRQPFGKELDPEKLKQLNEAYGEEIKIKNNK